MNNLVETARLMLADPKGLLAMDESPGTCNKRFAQAGIEQTEESRRRYRELILTTPGLADYVSGVILHDETIRQSRADGTPFVKLISDAGIIAGVKVDTGAKDLAGHTGEKITEGLDGLRERLRDYFAMGARFAKWRAVIALGDSLPTNACIDANAHALARYAALCQDAGLVAIVEPEVLMEGDHSLARCQRATEQVLRAVFEQLYVQNVALDAIILKPNMVLPGLSCHVQPSADKVADATIQAFRRVVPAATAGIAFLSGGQSGELASVRLNAMNAKFKAPSAAAPWPLTFSFSRALQHPALGIWAGKDANTEAAQRALLHRAKCNSAARRGQYAPSMEVS
ncbi:fructose-bisphosphate aldolase [Rhodoblastus sphagnicola]|uniref:Probable fructose-bisphosphate aldolase class 1 n=1 Tax=Rhodoblastus sphagnicola TaxID=333368 RepID=A0A2S6MVE9_9HYPH|nr:class I fructose-bisphosphate aldolase [Rhodoblastus sphagnicola]MBB4197569.1 fructose-bisphosphate aldolase class I [Rhodoblastus sphagnicola]PPQ26343.1 fructose-bisphosphate aldolase [Rhodoblastus sphagnicola]